MIRDDAAAASYILRETGREPLEPLVGFVARHRGIETGAIAVNSGGSGDCEVTVVARHLSRGDLRTVGRYVFGELGCRRVTARTGIANTPAIKALTRLGFVAEGVLRGWDEDGDGLQMSLLRRDWRFSEV